MFTKPLLALLSAGILLASSGPALAANQTFTAAGTYEVKMPESTNKVYITLIGAGGGGSAAGGGAGVTLVCTYNLYAGQIVTLVVGAGGKAGTSGAAGAAGGESGLSFNPGGYQLSAKGGKGATAEGGKGGSALASPECGLSSGGNGTATAGGKPDTAQASRLEGARREAKVEEEERQFWSKITGMPLYELDTQKLEYEHNRIIHEPEIAGAADAVRAAACKTAGSGGAPAMLGADGCASIDY